MDGTIECVLLLLFGACCVLGLWCYFVGCWLLRAQRCNVRDLCVTCAGVQASLCEREWRRRGCIRAPR
eukprot:COSAG02_NODE_1334_length_13206_cov_8.144427_7_plen_68_part_00